MTAIAPSSTAEATASPSRRARSRQRPHLGTSSRAGPAAAGPSSGRTPRGPAPFDRIPTRPSLLASSALQVREGLLRHVNFYLIDIAPGPLLARLKRRHHGMVCVVGMLGGVAARRAVTTTDVAAAQTEAQMNPRRARFQALFTAFRRAWGNGVETDPMFANHYGTPPSKTHPNCDHTCCHADQQASRAVKRPPSRVYWGTRPCNRCTKAVCLAAAGGF